MIVRTRYAAWGFSDIEHVEGRLEAEAKAAALRWIHAGYPEPIEVTVEPETVDAPCQP